MLHSLCFVPPPPEGSEEVIQRAMRGEEEIHENNEEAWFVPVIVSDPRSDVDKGEYHFVNSPSAKQTVDSTQ